MLYFGQYRFRYQAWRFRLERAPRGWGTGDREGGLALLRRPGGARRAGLAHALVGGAVAVAVVAAVASADLGALTVGAGGGRLRVRARVGVGSL